MKNKIFLSLIVAIMFSVAHIPICAQVYDGITQPSKFRVFVPISVGLHDGGKTSVSPFFAYKHDAAGWMSVTAVAQYNISSEAFIPQIWLNFNLDKKLYFLSRSIYDTKAEKYRHTLSATYKLPYGFMIDTTWENLYNGDKFCDTDRLQFLGGYAYKWFVANAGYSCRNQKGFIANLRLKVDELNWLQLKYDGGTESVQIGCVLQFN